MVIDTAAEDALLDLLNTTPLVAGAPDDLLEQGPRATRWLRDHGADGSEAERVALSRARDALQAVVRGQAAPESLQALLTGSHYLPAAVTEQGIDWAIRTPAGHRPAVLAVLAWSALQTERPGRLRPCANPECHLFLLDRSKPNKGRWCSMAVCGNRMKARRHYQRSQEAAAAQD